MTDRFQRNKQLIGIDNQNKIFDKNIIVFGIGGVGAMLTETLVRCGILNITIVDYDTIDISNINRQVLAFDDNIGLKKTDELEKIIKRINPEVNIKKINKKLTRDNIEEFSLKTYDYIADCIDTVTSKIFLSKYAYDNKLNIISSMGAGNKMNPLDFTVSNITETKHCPLARVMRTKLKKMGVDKLKVVYSKEIPKVKSIEKEEIRKSTPSSISFIPPTVGLIMASEIIKDIIEWKI